MCVLHFPKETNKTNTKYQNTTVDVNNLIKVKAAAVYWT